MGKEQNNTKTAKIKELIPDDKNANIGNEFGDRLIENSLAQFGAGRSILVDKNNRIIAGNKTAENAAAIGLEDALIVETTGDKLVVVKRTDVDIDSAFGREMAIADNATAKANITWDTDVLKDFSEQYDFSPEAWGIALEEMSEAETMEQVPYTSKIKAPTYEPKKEKAPDTAELYSTTRRDELLKEIEDEKEIPDDIRRFLSAAAERFTVFQFDKIAEYYAHASKRVQNLMENSALVIIDYDKAIERGFVKLTEELMNEYDLESEGV